MVAGADSDPLDIEPMELRELCGEEEFAELVEEMVADEAPRLFAIVQEVGTRVDARIAAWGMAFADEHQVISVHGGIHRCGSSTNSLMRRFRAGAHVRPRLVWVNPGAASVREDESVS